MIRLILILWSIMCFIPFPCQIVPDIVVGASSSTDVVQPTSTSPSISSQTTSDVATTAQTG